MTQPNPPAEALHKHIPIPPLDTLVIVYEENGTPLPRYSKGFLDKNGHLACWHKGLPSKDFADASESNHTFWPRWNAMKSWND